MRRFLILALAVLTVGLAGCAQAPTGANDPAYKAGQQAKKQAEQMRQQSQSKCGMDPYTEGCPGYVKP